MPRPHLMCRYSEHYKVTTGALGSVGSHLANEQRLHTRAVNLGRLGSFFLPNRGSRTQGNFEWPIIYIRVALAVVRKMAVEQTMPIEEQRT